MGSWISKPSIPREIACTGKGGQMRPSRRGGHAHAAFLLGRQYQGADRKDPAIRWYRLAAIQPSAAAVND
jgi:hypothetical protein